MFGSLGVLVQIAIRNLFSSLLNFIIGGIIFLGTLLVVVGGAFLDSLDASMSKSVIGSVAGHLQVYSSKSKDELALYGSMGGEPDIAAMTEFSKVKEQLSQHPNVKTVVPMGVSAALVNSGNTVDMTLSRLRDAYKARDGQGPENGPQRTKEEWNAQIDSQKQHVRQIVKVLQGDFEKAKAVRAADASDQEDDAVIAKVSSDAFWSTFDQDPYEGMEFMENKIAPLVTDADMLFIRYVGTDLDQFEKSFDRMKIVDGTPVPQGQRGFLIAKFIYEDQLKLKTARRLDEIKEALDARSGATIKGNPVLERMVKENQSQTREIVLQLDGLKSQKMVAGLQKLLDDKDEDLSTLLTRFFTLDDASFQTRYAFFYREMAPLLELYRVRVGDMLTIKAFTRAGSVQSVNQSALRTVSWSSSPSGHPRRSGSGSGFGPCGTSTHWSSSSKTPSLSASRRGQPRRFGSGLAPMGSVTHWSSLSKTPSLSVSTRGHPRRAGSGCAPCGVVGHTSSGPSTPSPSVSGVGGGAVSRSDGA